MNRLRPGSSTTLIELRGMAVARLEKEYPLKQIVSNGPCRWVRLCWTRDFSGPAFFFFHFIGRNKRDRFYWALLGLKLKGFFTVDAIRRLGRPSHDHFVPKEVVSFEQLGLSTLDFAWFPPRPWSNCFIRRNILVQERASSSRRKWRTELNFETGL